MITNTSGSRPGYNLKITAAAWSGLPERIIFQQAQPQTLPSFETGSGNLGTEFRITRSTEKSDPSRLHSLAHPGRNQRTTVSNWRNSLDEAENRRTRFIAQRGNPIPPQPVFRISREISCSNGLPYRPYNESTFWIGISPA